MLGMNIMILRRWFNMKKSIINQCVKEITKAFDDALEQSLDYAEYEGNVAETKEYFDAKEEIIKKFLAQFKEEEK